MTPKISVIIPTFNRANFIASALDSVFNQTYSDFEIILIDDGSTDNTKEVINPYLERIRYIYQENTGVAGACNRGIQNAKGDYIITMGDDVIVDPHWLEFLAQCFQENSCDGVGGRVLPIYPDSTPAWVKKNPGKISGGVVICDYGEETVIYHPSEINLIGTNLAFRKEIFHECGSFREDLKFDERIALGEDTELIERVYKKNKTLYYCGKAIVYHPVDLKRLTLRYAARWNLALGRFSARQENEDKEKNFIYWFGIPRYLWRGIIIDSLRLCTSIVNRPALYDACRSFFRKVGMIIEYRKILLKSKIT